MTPRYHIMETEWGDVNVDADWYDANEKAALDKVYPPFMDRSQYAKGVKWVVDNFEFAVFKMARLWSCRMKARGDNPSNYLWSPEVGA
jgi:hypothetical protein